MNVWDVLSASAGWLLVGVVWLLGVVIVVLLVEFVVETVRALRKKRLPIRSIKKAGRRND